jgi:hypothetical protein
VGVCDWIGIMNMWTVDTTKVAFLGATAHWIEVKREGDETWEVRSEVIGF